MNNAALTPPATAALAPLSPTRSRLPALHFAISHGGADLRLPAFALAPYDSSSSNSSHTSDDDDAHCATPHFALSSASFYPEASPTLKTPAAATPLAHYCRTTDKDTTTTSAAATADELQRRKRGTRRGTLNPEAKSVLKAWMFSPEHFAHPYPSEEEKEELATEAGIEVKQLSNWFTNARKRLWQPVLRQSGVEVKNFLSTGRGGPRGSKLDVLPTLVPLSPPLSPRPRSNSSSAFSEVSTASSSSSPLKRAWADVEASLPSDDETSSAVVVPTKRKKTSAAVANVSTRLKKSTSSRKPAIAQIASQLSEELRVALAERTAATTADAPTFQELEILAATSLIGLHQQQYQPVH